MFKDVDCPSKFPGGTHNHMFFKLRDCIAEAEADEATDEYTETRLRDLHSFFETTMGWYQTVRGWPTAVLIRFMKLGDKTLKLLGLVRG